MFLSFPSHSGNELCESAMLQNNKPRTNIPKSFLMHRFYIKIYDLTMIAVEFKNSYFSKKKSLFNNIFGAARETRTLTGKTPLGPQPSLSTNSSIAALLRQNKLMTTFVQVGRF